MLGFKIFLLIYLNIDEKCQSRILGNIFQIENVSVSSVLVENDRIIFKMFDGVVFYQYTFSMDMGKDKLYRDERIFNYVCYLPNKKKVNKFIYQLSRCSFEQEVYHLLRKVL